MVEPAVGFGGKPSRTAVWTGRIIAILVVLFIALDGITKVVNDPYVLSAMTDLVFPERTTVGMGVVVLVCTVLYAIFQTCITGAVLLNGNLGGAVGVQVKSGSSLFESSFPIISVFSRGWESIFANPDYGARATQNATIKINRKERE